MTVWVVIERMHDSKSIVGIYSTRTDAEAVCARLERAREEYTDPDYRIEEWLVQPSGDRGSSLDGLIGR